MPARRANPMRVKLHRSYSVPELALCCGVHKNTIRHWQAKGLEPVDSSRPALFQGATVRAFLAKAKASRKRPCPPGTLYCLRCRQPRKPALGMVDFVPITDSSGNIGAICETCETVMHRRARFADLGRIMPDCTVQITQRQIRLKGRGSPSLNCDKERQV
jgi:hypothetical protein